MQSVEGSTLQIYPTTNAELKSYQLILRQGMTAARPLGRLDGKDLQVISDGGCGLVVQGRRCRQRAVPQPPPDVRLSRPEQGVTGVFVSCRTTLTSRWWRRRGLARLINARSPSPSISVGWMEGLLVAHSHIFYFSKAYRSYRHTPHFCIDYLHPRKQISFTMGSNSAVTDEITFSGMS